MTWAEYDVSMVTKTLEDADMSMDDEIGNEISKPRRGIQSIEMGLRIIESLRLAYGPQTLKELAKSTRIPASNCHRYLVSFISAGFVVQEPRSSRYELGRKIAQAGIAALSRLDFVQVGTDALTHSVESTGHTGLLAVWSDRGAVIVRWMSGVQAVRTSLSVGATLPLLTSATGSVFLAFLPRRETIQLVEAERAGSDEEPDALAAAVRASGIGQVSGRHIPGLSAAAAPILDGYGNAVAVVTLVGRANIFNERDIAVLRGAALAASERLGFQAPR